MTKGDPIGIDNLVNFGFVLICLFILYSLIKADSVSYPCKKHFLVSSMVLLLISIAFVMILFACVNAKNRKSMDTIVRFFGNPSIILFLFLIQILFVYNYCFETGWDAQTLLSTGRQYVLKGNIINEGYFSQYPNNLFLLSIFVQFMKIEYLITKTGDNLGVYSILLVQCIINSFVAYLLHQIITELTKSYRAARFGLFFYALLIGLSPWVSIPYSDSFGLLFPILIFACYIKQYDNAKDWKMWGAIAFLTYVGYCIKPQCIIISISILIISFFKNPFFLNPSILKKYYPHLLDYS